MCPTVSLSLYLLALPLYNSSCWALLHSVLSLPRTNNQNKPLSPLDVNSRFILDKGSTGAVGGVRILLWGIKADTQTECIQAPPTLGGWKQFGTLHWLCIAWRCLLVNSAWLQTAEKPVWWDALPTGFYKWLNCKSESLRRQKAAYDTRRQ